MSCKLYFLLVGCRLKGRHTEQHDVFFGVGESLSDLIPALHSFWPQAENLHIDCWREVTNVNGYSVDVVAKEDSTQSGLSLFFINMGGYRKGEFEEFHFKDLFVSANPEEAIKLARQTKFYKEFGFKGAVSHIDNKYGVDIDEIYPIEEILSPADKSKYSILITNDIPTQIDEIHLGYMPLSKLKNL